MTTIRQALRAGAQNIEKNGIPAPRLEAELLLSACLKKPREFILSRPETKLGPIASLRYRRLLRRRAQGAPLAYLSGQKGFYGRDFHVNGAVLVPRPETELMLEEFMRHEARMVKPGGRRYLIDLGTGSGCIIVSLAKELQASGQPLSGWRFYALDISARALKTAAKNAERHGVKELIDFRRGDLLEPLQRQPAFGADASDIIIFANLPYLSPEQIKRSPTIKKEPVLALSGGADGLRHYRTLLKQLSGRFGAGRRILAYLEIDDRQKQPISRLVAEHLPTARCRIKTDYRGQNRLVILEKPAQARS